MDLVVFLEGANIEFEVGSELNSRDVHDDAALANRLVPDISATRMVAELLSPDVTSRVETFDRRVVFFFEEDPQVAAFQREAHPKEKKENKTL